ncbi:phosphotransferase, partial [Actinoplanes philippinensis]|uniref:phosphotransferase n=1 Tax=Actinoplanes philippinensis TaxID=35752 RepID=UPI0033FE36E8
SCAPRYRGCDDSGRDVLEFLDGTVPWGTAPAFVRGDGSLAAAGRLVREFHDLTAGTALAADQEVVCHHDLSPKNTVYRGTAPVAFIDWDDASPGRRVQDVAHLCWQFAGLGPGTPDAVEAGRLVRVIAGAYGLSAPDRAVLVDTILWWQDATWRGILAAAEAGDPAMTALRDAGTVEQVRAAHDWTARHRAALEPG